MTIISMLLLMGLGTAAFGYPIIKPLSRASARGFASHKFQTCDLLALPGLIAIPLLFISRAQHWREVLHQQAATSPFRAQYGNDAAVFLVVATTLIAVIALSWWRSVDVLSRAGVKEPKKRMLFLNVILPVVIIGSSFVCPIIAGTSFTLGEMSNRNRTIWVCGFALTVLVAIFCRQLVNWVLTSRESPT